MEQAVMRNGGKRTKTFTVLAESSVDYEPSIVPRETITIPSPVFTRFNQGDMIENGQWLADRVRERWHHLTERTAIGWIKSCLDFNEMAFFKSPHAVSLFQIVHRSLNPDPEVEEIFLFCDHPDDPAIQAEGAAHYVRIQEWARTRGASKIAVWRNSDVPLDMIREAMGSVQERCVYMAGTARSRA